jgi:DNA polymerase III epsilon subunit-like protein
MMKPFSDNVIFWDTEFTSLNPYEGEIISIGMVKNTGEELYLELEIDPNWKIDPWVIENVMPYLNGPKTSRSETIQKMTEFIGPNKPYMVSFVNQYDVVYLYKLIGVQSSTKNFPFNWIHMDIASMLFGNGIDPERFRNAHPNSLGKELSHDKTQYREHHALDDAKQVRDLYVKLTANNV